MLNKTLMGIIYKYDKQMANKIMIEKIDIAKERNELSYIHKETVKKPKASHTHLLHEIASQFIWVLFVKHYQGLGHESASNQTSTCESSKHIRL